MEAKAQSVDRRNSGVRTQGRAAKVISSVLDATCEELNRVGYANLRVEEVAARAGVHKTTVYRRWPTKASLVSETLDTKSLLERPLPETGSLREDMLAYLEEVIQRSKTPRWRGVLTALSSRTDPEVEAVASKLYRRERQYRTRLVERAIERGELPKSVDAELIGDMFSAPVFRRLLNFNEELERDYVEAVVDVTLSGAAVLALRKS